MFPKAETTLFGPYGGVSDAGFQRFRNSEANALWFHGFNPEMFELAEAAGKAACVEFKTFRAAYRDNPELIPLSADGSPLRYAGHLQGICLSKQWYIDERMEALTAGMQRFRPAGVWLDYLTYGGWFESPEPDLQDNCFCPDCIEEFRVAGNIDAAGAQDIIDNHLISWQRHKIERMGRYVKLFANLIRNADPDCIVGAYMCPWTPDEFNGAIGKIFGQDYDEFAKSIDVFTPLIYCRKCGRDADWAREWLEVSPRFVPSGKKVQPILDYLDFPASFESLFSAHSSAWGLQLFSGSKVFESDESAQIFNRAVGKALAG